MTQEDKELLLTDLCARLPYGVKFHYFPNEGSKGTEAIGTATCWDGDVQCVETNDEGFNIENIKLYLRPMSSMTEEELAEWQFELDMDIDGYCIPSYPALDWLNAHHFDYRGLIKKGLAFEAPEDMYKTE